MAEQQVTIIGPGATFKGELSFEGAGRILGTFEGSIRAGGELHIGQGAQCRATVEADTILVDGSVQGDLLGRERIQLSSKANVQGDVTAAALVVAEGATFIGRCCVGAEAVKQAAAKAPIAEPKAVKAPRSNGVQNGSPEWMAEPALAGGNKPSWLNGTET